MNYYDKVQSMPDEWIEQEINKKIKIQENLKDHEIVCLRQEKEDRINAGIWKKNATI